MVNFCDEKKKESDVSETLSQHLNLYVEVQTIELMNSNERLFGHALQVHPSNWMGFINRTKDQAGMMLMSESLGCETTLQRT